jgi:hypothetical protein
MALSNSSPATALGRSEYAEQRDCNALQRIISHAFLPLNPLRPLLLHSHALAPLTYKFTISILQPASSDYRLNSHSLATAVTPSRSRNQAIYLPFVSVCIAQHSFYAQATVCVAQCSSLPNFLYCRIKDIYYRLPTRDCY